jgi:hypothetical protein
MNLESIDQAVLDFCKNLSARELEQLPFRKLPFSSPEKSWILEQAQLYQKARTKLQNWWERGDLLFPDRTALEQCTNPVLAQWKAHFLGSFPWIWDACAGLGIDASVLGKKSAPIVLTEPDLNRAACLKINFQKLGFEQMNVLSSPWSPDLAPDFPGPGLLLADPDRRPDSGKRISSWKDASPNLSELYQFAKDRKIRLLVKFSPLDDPDEIQVNFPGMSSLFFLSFHNELKEVGAFWDFSGPDLPAVPNLLGVECRSDGKWTQHPVMLGNPGPMSWTEARSGQFLLDPWVAFRRKQYGLNTTSFPAIQALAPDTRLFVQDGSPHDFPGRVFRILSSHKQLKEAAAAVGGRDCHVVVRNYPVQAEEIRKKLKWTERGDVYLFCLENPGGRPQFLVVERQAERFSKGFWQGPLEGNSFRSFF